MWKPRQAVLAALLLMPVLGAAAAGKPGKGKAESTDAREEVSVPAGTPVLAAREIVLDEKSTGRVFAIRTARNVLTTVEFPEDMVGRPACGDCEGDQGPEGEALYRMAVSAQGRYVTLRPNANARRPKDGDTGTTMLVRMEHATLTLYVEQADRARADTRVVFSYPNRTSDTEYLRVERAKIEAELNTKAEVAFRGRMLRAMQEPHACVRKSARNRIEDLVLEVKEMCYFGRDLFFTFSIENRGRTPMEVGAVIVSRGENLHDDLGGGRVEGDVPSVGAVSVHLADGEALKGPYELTIHEKGGKERVISVGRLEF